MAGRTRAYNQLGKGSLFIIQSSPLVLRHGLYTVFRRVGFEGFRVHGLWAKGSSLGVSELICGGRPFLSLRGDPCGGDSCGGGGPAGYNLPMASAPIGPHLQLANLQTRKPAGAYACTYTFTYVCIYIYTCVYVCIYTYTEVILLLSRVLRLISYKPCGAPDLQTCVAERRSRPQRDCSRGPPFTVLLGASVGSTGYNTGLGLL